MIAKKLFITAAVVLLTIAGCSTSEPLTDRFPDLVEVNPPDRVPFVEKDLSISGIELVTINKRSKALHISGSFPNGCTSLLRADENIEPEILNVEMIGWQLYQQECTESPSAKNFSYLVTDITNEEWENIGWVYINGKEYILDKTTE